MCALEVSTGIKINKEEDGRIYDIHLISLIMYLLSYVTIKITRLSAICII